MGWLFTSKAGPRGQAETLEFFKREFAPREGSGGVVDCAIAANTAYLVYQHSDGERYAVVCLLSRRDGSFGYKDMDEGMGPFEANCPARILNQLSPTASIFSEGNSREYARTWRAKCRVNIDKRAEFRKLKARMTDGVTIKLPEAITFSGGQSEDTFKVVAQPGRRRDLFRSKTVGLCRIPARLLQEAEVVS